jgi:hypothetical protein
MSVPISLMAMLFGRAHRNTNRAHLIVGTMKPVSKQKTKVSATKLRKKDIRRHLTLCLQKRPGPGWYLPGGSAMTSTIPAAQYSRSSRDGLDERGWAIVEGESIANERHLPLANMSSRKRPAYSAMAALVVIKNTSAVDDTQSTLTWLVSVSLNALRSDNVPAA